jgi:hypothetical protein
MAHSSSVFAENSTFARSNVELSYCITDWSFPLVRGSDSQRLPSSSEALAGAGAVAWDSIGQLKSQLLPLWA